MTAEERRAAIIEILAQSTQPVSASALAGRFGVSRQLIVGDVALLRAGGASITPSWQRREATCCVGSVRGCCVKRRAATVRRTWSRNYISW